MTFTMKRFFVSVVILLTGCFALQGTKLDFLKIGQLHAADYTDMVINGNHAFCTTGGHGIDVIDISVPASPVKAAHYEYPGVIYAAGKYAYIAHTSNGFHVHDISSVSIPTKLGACSMSPESWDTATSIYVAGNYAYVTIKHTGMEIFDISNPAYPASVGVYTYRPIPGFDTPPNAHKVFVKGNYAYLADYDYGVHVVDISTPSSPVSVKEMQPATNIHDIFVNGNHLYLAAHNAGLMIYDISTPSSPAHAATYGTDSPSGSGARDVVVSGSYAYAVFGYHTMDIINVSDPTTPVLAGRYDESGFYDNVALAGNYAFTTSGYQLDFHAIDISNSGSPKKAGGFDNFDEPFRSSVQGNLAYIADHDKGLQVVDISNPESPTPVNSIDWINSPVDVVARGNYVYLLTSSIPTGHLYIFDISPNPMFPSLKGSCNTGGHGRGLFIDGNYAYVADGANGNGLTIIDISSAAAPAVVGTYKTTVNDYPALKVFVQGNHAYIAYERSGLHIVDVSNPANPVLTYRYDVTGYTVTDVFVKDNYAYLAHRQRGPVILDISDPSSPKKVGEKNIAFNGDSEITVNGDYAYFTAFQEGLYVLNVSNPGNPITDGYYLYDNASAGHVCLQGNYLYLSDRNAYMILEQNGDSGFSTAWLTVTSQPETGVPITVSPTDLNGAGNNHTDFSRTYTKGIAITLTAPDSYNGIPFLKWQINGQDVSPGSTELYFHINGDTQAKAVYSSDVLSVSRSHLIFGADTSGQTTGSQQFQVIRNGTGTVNWSVSADQSWIRYNPPDGTDVGTVTVSVDPAGMNSGTYNGTITIADSSSGDTYQQVTVALTIHPSGQTDVPFGVFSTPLDGSTVYSSIPVTGWVLDDLGVDSVKIYRQESGTPIYIGDAVLVEGARPDVEAAYPGYPNNHKAGWGYMMLTNFFPGQGNGVFTITAVATDREGNSVTLGSKTITIDNANAEEPFGAIDTPRQGEIVSGTQFINWGWALTPQPNIIPTIGNTINVYIDGVSIGFPVYNVYREDIAGFFPGYANSGGAVGYKYIDTTQYDNGVHSIYWVAVDDAGNTDGIGSRYFTIQNSGGNRSMSADAASQEAPRHRRYYQIPDMPQHRDIPVRIKELELMVIDLSDKGTVIDGFTVIGQKLARLPIGTTIKDNKLHWSPGVGHVGQYRLLLVIKGPDDKSFKQPVTVTIDPRF